ncbi:MAG: DJ-1/PfpI family protein [Lachnospiraceae bacterium]|nr:DJ-1/PfpI family protein [Lachnospiraceae bacterium]
MLGMFFAEGFEEIEAVTTVDLLRRAGIDLKMISIGQDTKVTGAHGIPVITDEVMAKTDFGALSGIILPGGAPGFKNLEASSPLMAKVEAFSKESGKLVAAICGAPSLLGHRGLLDGRKATIFPGMEGELGKASPVKDRAVTDGEFITSRGAGTAVDFALEIVKYYKGGDAAEKLAAGIVYR